MIVKVIARDADVTIWNESGDRLYYSDQANDIDFAKKLIDQYKTQHYMATWRKGIVAIRKPVTGYGW